MLPLGFLKRRIFLYFLQSFKRILTGLARYHGWFNQGSQSRYLNPDHNSVLRTNDTQTHYFKSLMEELHFLQKHNWQVEPQNTAQTLFPHVANGTETTSQCSPPCSTCRKSVRSSARLWLMRAVDRLPAGCKGQPGKSIERGKVAWFIPAGCLLEWLLVRASWHAFRGWDGA